MDIVLKVVKQGFLSLYSLMHSFVEPYKIRKEGSEDLTVVKSPDISWETLAEMPNDELNFRKAIEDPVATKTKCVNTDSRGKNLWSPPWAALPQLLDDCRRRQTWMHIYRNIEVLDSLPEDVVIVLVVVEHGVAIGSAGLPCSNQLLSRRKEANNHSTCIQQAQAS